MALALLGAGGACFAAAASLAADDIPAGLPPAARKAAAAPARETTEVIAMLNRSALPAAVPALAATAPAPDVATCGLHDFQAAMLARINQYRAAGANCRTAGTYAPAPPLVWNTRLVQAAAAHSTDMATRNYFSHISLDGRTLVERIEATGYARHSLGENIAAGHPTVHAVVDGWMASDGHCANLMNPAFRDVGLACVSSPTSTYRRYWTMEAGKPR
jgi:uncharacterized protein YkwD